MWYKKQIKLTVEEQDILEVIKTICQNPSSEVRIDPNCMDYYISNLEKHYSVIITSSSIHITNTVDNDSMSHREAFLDLCKKEARERAHLDRMEVKNSMLLRRSMMLTRMKENLR